MEDSEGLGTRAVEWSDDWVVPEPTLEPGCAGWEGVCVTVLWCVTGGFLVVVGLVAGVGGTDVVSLS